MDLMYMPLLLLFNIVICSPQNSKFKEGFKEKVDDQDGIFNSLDNKHYKDGKHNHEFDHEVVLGSHDAAQEFGHLSPAEAKKRLYHLATKMDENKDQFVEREELINWILRSFKLLTLEEASDEFEDEDTNEDGKVTWEEHATEVYGLHNDDDREINSIPEDSKMYEHDMILFKAADLNMDGILDKREFPAFSHPEEFEYMHFFIYKQTMDKKDKNNDSFLTFDEFIVDNYGASPAPDSELYIVEKDRFYNVFDFDGDKKLNKQEVMSWIIPDNRETAENEADHLIESSDTDKDGKLSLEEIVENYDVFVGSEATEFGEQLENFNRFNDEL